MHNRPPPGDRLLGTLLSSVVDVTIQRVAEQLDLSARECLVLRYLALGYLYREIADELCISKRTVKMHVANMRQKVGAGNRAELVKVLFAA